MAYTEIKERNKRKYFYRVISIRESNKVKKKRKYLGANLKPNILSKKEIEADKDISNNKKKNDIDKIKEKIIPILKKNKVRKAGIFGSYVRGEQKKGSDIDILIEPPPGMGLEFVSLALKLEKILDKRVDLLTYNGISPYLKERILKEEVRII